jgi:hypothetical protein
MELQSEKGHIYFSFVRNVLKCGAGAGWGNEEVLLTVKEQRNILHEISKWKANWIGHILRRNCLLRQVIEGKIKGAIEVTGRRGRRRESYCMTLRKGEDTHI